MTQSIALVLNTPTLLSNLDALKLELLPLSDHFAVKCDEHSRETYGSLLAALLLTGGEISAEQSRLFKLLLGSLKLGDIQAQLFERAQALNLDALREFFRVARENQLTTSFFMDALVLCRLSGPLVDAQHQLLSELADLLKLPEADLPVIASLAAVALGLPCEVDIPSEFDRATVSAWEEFLFRTLTADRLAAGVLRGWWLVTEPIKVNATWSMENARVRFTGEGSLTSETEGRISISRCHLERPIIILSGKLSFFLQESLVDGVYEEHGQTAAISLNSVLKAVFNKTKFQTIYATSISLSNSTSELVECDFSECGNLAYCGGAIKVQSDLVAVGYEVFRLSYEITIHYCSFVGCLGRVGGGVYASALNDGAITNSNFIDCKSAYYPENILDNLNTYVFGGGAIFTLYSNKNIIDGCIFKNTTINIGDPGLYNSYPVLNNSVLNDSCVSARRIHNPNPWQFNCIFNNKFYKTNHVVTPASSQKWWSEFK